MRSICLLLLSGFVVSSHGWLCAAEIPVIKPEEVGMSAAKLAVVDQVMGDLVAQKKLAGGTVLVARRGKIAHFESYGFRDVEAKLPMRNDSIVRIYSMTKAITSAATLMLVDDGKLALDDPVSKFIPEMREMRVIAKEGETTPAGPMTVRHLLTHTSGLTYGNSGPMAMDKLYKEANLLDPEHDLAAMAPKLGKIPLAFEPGKDWAYSISTDVLGRVVEVAAGKPLDQVFQERLFQPLDMRDTGFFVPADKVDRFATNYNSDGNGKLTVIDAATTSRYLKTPPLLSGGGGLVSTARDYLRFLLMISQRGEWDGRRLLSEESVALMTTNQLPASVGWIKFGGLVRGGVGFGLGFSVREKTTIWDPHGRVGEYGWGGAASTHYWVSPKDEVIVITLEQTMPFSFLTEFAVKGPIYDAILPR